MGKRSKLDSTIIPEDDKNPLYSNLESYILKSDTLHIHFENNQIKSDVAENSTTWD